jgi:hypothetical protein
MDVAAWLRYFASQFEFLQTLWMLGAGSAPFALWLLFLTGFVFAQLNRRPRAMGWFLAALGLTIVWEGGAGAILLPHLTGLWNDGTPEVDLAETVFVWFIWCALPTAIQAIAACCLLKAAFGEPSPESVSSAEEAS